MGLRARARAVWGIATGFVFPLDVELVDASGASHRLLIDLTGRVTTTPHGLAAAPRSIVVDPDEYAIAVTTCTTTSPCKPDYRCETGVCLPP